MGLDSWIVANEAPLRLSFFFGILIFMMLWEFISPRRQLRESRMVRWGNNLGLVFLNTMLLRWILPMTAIGVTLLARERDWGILNNLEIDMVWATVISVVVLDMVIYLQHVMVHAVPLLWRLHRVHHADLDYDVTTGARFHPIEILLSMLIKFAVILLLGPPVVAVILFEVILNGMAMFNHGNVLLPLPLDRVMRLFLVTPDMHRVHHSVEDDEANSNFGFNLSIWDRIFGTYTAQPRAGHDEMTIGIHKYRDMRWCGWLPGMLTMPFVGKISRYAINRRSWSDES